MKRINSKLIAVTVLLAVLSVGVMCTSHKIFERKEIEVSSSQEVLESLPPVEEKPKKTSVSFAAAGDNLVHDNIYKQALERTGGESFDFTLPYEQVEELISCKDLAFINQEAPIAEDVAPLSGYPCFNAPKAVGERMTDMGFNLVGIANNHMFDKGDAGLLAHMDFWESREEVLLCMGAWRNPEDMKKPLLVEKNGITFGFVPMTEHTNGLNAQKGSSIRYIRTDEWELIKPQIDMINRDADFQIAVVHWGTEGSLDANEGQKYLAKKLSDEGIDLIIGCHSHTLQPLEWIVREDGTRTLVIYSLGNFISSQSAAPNMLGAVMQINIEKNLLTNETYISSARLHPVVTHYDGNGRRDVRIIPLERYTNELASKHGVRAVYPGFSVEYLESIVSKNVPFEFLQEIPVNP